MRKGLVLMWLFWYLFWMAERILPRTVFPSIRVIGCSQELKDTVRFRGEVEELS
jgi:hypothetical protein